MTTFLKMNLHSLLLDIYYVNKRKKQKRKKGVKSLQNIQTTSNQKELFEKIIKV